MNLITHPGRINLQKPVFEFYEEGDWMRIVVPGQKDRFLPKKKAIWLLNQIGMHARSDKSDLSL